MAGLPWEPEVTWLTSIPLWRCWVGPGWQDSLVHAGPGVCRLKQEGEHAGTRDILRSVCFRGIWLFTQIVELLK